MTLEDHSPRKRVYFHIGAPKSGTTFFQDLLWLSREQLAADGVLYPLRESRDYLGATMDICERAFGGRWDPEWTGAWDRIADATRAWTGDCVVFSAELMGLANPGQAKRAVESVQPAEVHLIYTARDLARQMPSEWQEQVKHLHAVSWAKFVDDLVELGLDAPAPFGELFWGLHDGAYVLARWEGLVPPERIHVVTVPPVGSPPSTLWERLASVIGVDATAYDTSVARPNQSMGMVETEFMRRFNAATRHTLTYKHGPVLNRVLGQEILGGRPDKDRIRIPQRHRAWLEARSARLIDELGAAGYDVVGSLDELVPDFRADEGQDDQASEKLPPAAINKIAFAAIAGLVDHVLSLRGRTRRLAEELEKYAPGRATAMAEEDRIEEGGRLGP